MAEGKIYTKVCRRCGKEFQTHKIKMQLCPDCKAEKKKEWSSVRNEDNRKPKQTFHRTVPDVLPIRPYTAIIEQYNKTHGTCYTYGQFEMLRFLKKITKEEINDLQREKGTA